jgi:hypothetical protein
MNPQWQILRGPQNAAPAQVQHVQGFASFNYLLVPLTDQVEATPEIPFSYFDPREELHLDLTIPPVPVVVLPGAAPSEAVALRTEAIKLSGPDEETLTFADPSAQPGRTVASLAPLQQRAWFPLVQAAPAMLLFGLWGWDRRRRHLEAHPEILLKRRARRAMRRQWREAAQRAAAHDAAGFARGAAQALRSGCSPFFPAEPRALVGADVLSVVGAEKAEPAATGLLRDLFATTDAAEYGQAPPRFDAVISRQAELAALVRQLEERLKA